MMPKLLDRMSFYVCTEHFTVIRLQSVVQEIRKNTENYKSDSGACQTFQTFETFPL